MNALLTISLHHTSEYRLSELLTMVAAAPLAGPTLATRYPVHPRLWRLGSNLGEDEPRHAVPTGRASGVTTYDLAAFARDGWSPALGVAGHTPG
jgi:hypothetical protein